MAWAFVANRGRENTKTSTLTMTMSPIANIAAGQVALVRTVANNVGTAQGQTTEHSVTDDAGNFYTRVAENTRTDGAAADGVTTGAFVSKLIAAVNTTATVTFTLAASTTAKAMGIDEFAIGAGMTPSVVQIAAATGASSSPSVGLTGLTSAQYLMLGLAAVEGPSTLTFTQDSDYANNTTIGTSGGGGATNVAAFLGVRIATLTVDSYDVGVSNTVDWTTILAALLETPQPDTWGPEAEVTRDSGYEIVGY